MGSGDGCKDLEFTTSEERQLELSVVEAAVHAELADVAAVDETSKTDVRVLGLTIGERVEKVVGADPEVEILRRLVPEIHVEQQLGPERLVVQRVVGLVVDSTVVIRAHERRDPRDRVAQRREALLM